MGPEHFAIITECKPARNRIKETGPVKPSSESLTHGVLYDLDSNVHCVIHVHSPELWHAAERIQLPTTDPSVPVGSQELAAEVERLYAETDLRKRRVFSMGGHEDGIVAFGSTLESAVKVLLAAIEKASE